MAASLKTNRDEMLDYLQSYHHNRTMRIAQAFLDDCLSCIEHGNDLDDDDDEWRELLDQAVDSACTYTADNWLTLAASNNDGAYFDELGSAGIVNESGVNVAVMAYMALRADVVDILDRAGFDWSDPAETAPVALKWFE